MLNELIKKIAKAFSDNSVPYMLIGGQATLLYREPRFTNDIDITLGIGPDQVKKIINICKSINIKIIVDNPIDFVAQTMVLPAYDETSGFRIDLIFSLTNYESEAISRAKIEKIDDVDVYYSSLEDIIILKIFAGRDRDIDDVKSILKKNSIYNKKLIVDNLIDLGKAVDSDLAAKFISLLEN